MLNTTTIDPITLNQIRDHWKTVLNTKRRQLEENINILKIRKPSQTNAFLIKHCQLIDEVLLGLWHDLNMPPNWVLMAVGGYGRKEQFPKSDVDVMILIDNDTCKQAKETLETFVGLTWDIGLELAHSVRTTQQTLEEVLSDLTIQTALLEARYMVGPKKLFMYLIKKINEAYDIKKFFDGKVRELRQRHTKHQETPYALEPNCKESPGGLRDLHVILWICKAAKLGGCWSEIARQGLLTPVEARQLQRNENILKTIRLHLHLLTKRREDRLVFDIQTALAEKLGFQPKYGRRVSEVMMQQYHWAARTIWQLSDILLQNIKLQLWEHAQSPVLDIDSSFTNRDGFLDIRDHNILQKQPSEILRAFLVMQKHPELKGMSPRLQRALWNQRFLIDAKFRNNPDNQALFISFLQQPRGIVHELRRMAKLSILGRYIPAFRRIVGQMQHDLFHVYTVDQHIMQVIRNLRRFTMVEHAHEYPFCSQLIANFDAVYLLYIAALFHDIAKGRGGDHSVLGKHEVKRFSKLHQLPKEDENLVSFLVEHHLTMSSIAQKKDLSDPDVIEKFVNLVGNERRLTALYLLTVADIRGTSPKVWNTWKGKLLEELYQLTLRALGGEIQSRRQLLLERQTEAKRLLRLSAFSEQAHEELWNTLDVPFFMRNDPNEVAWATRHLHNAVKTNIPIVKARLSPLGDSLQVLIYCQDQTDLFSRLCAYFDSKNLNILDARINTTTLGYALDSFLVSNPTEQSFYRELIVLIENELSLNLTNPKTLTQTVKGRVSRQSKHFPIHPSVEISADDCGKYFLLQITATDHVGLLSSIARTLAAHQVTIHSAKIMTHGERVEDNFLINGSTLHSPREQLQIETDLINLLIN